MSSFGAYDIKTKEWGIDFLVSSSNKNLQGIPGFAYAICNLNVLKNCEGIFVQLAASKLMNYSKAMPDHYR